MNEERFVGHHNVMPEGLIVEVLLLSSTMLSFLRRLAPAATHSPLRMLIPYSVKDVFVI